jgi:Carboxypeptidase regulatory-like domain
MTARRCARIVVALSALMCAAQPAAAQRTTGAIIGTVQDASGAVLPGVAVSLASEAVPGNPVSTTTGSGSYEFLALPPGLYELTFSLSGFSTLKRAEIVVGVGSTLEVNVTLALSRVA